MSRDTLRCLATDKIKQPRNTTIKTLRIQRHPFNLENLDNRVHEQMRLWWSATTDGVIPPDSHPSQVVRTGHCHHYSSETIIALGTYWDIFNSAIVKLVRPSQDCEEQHHLVILENFHVIDLTINQFNPNGQGSTNSPSGGIPLLFMQPWQTAREIYKKLHFKVNYIYSRDEYLGLTRQYEVDKNRYSLDPIFHTYRQEIGLPIFKDHYYSNNHDSILRRLQEADLL